LIPVPSRLETAESVGPLPSFTDTQIKDKNKEKQVAAPPETLSTTEINDGEGDDDVVNPIRPKTMISLATTEREIFFYAFQLFSAAISLALNVESRLKSSATTFTVVLLVMAMGATIYRCRQFYLGRHLHENQSVKWYRSAILVDGIMSVLWALALGLRIGQIDGLCQVSSLCASAACMTWLTALTWFVSLMEELNQQAEGNANDSGGSRSLLGFLADQGRFLYILQFSGAITLLSISSRSKMYSMPFITFSISFTLVQAALQFGHSLCMSNWPFIFQ
jgi:hypothetical protein